MSFYSKDFKGFTFRSGPVKNTIKQNSHFWMDDNDDYDDVFAVFDDRQQVVDMWRQNGLTCFQVADGDF